MRLTKTFIKPTILLFQVLFLVGCAPSLLFTNEQFPDQKSSENIPENWWGEWNAQIFDSSLFYIKKDSVKISSFKYNIIQSKLNLPESNTVTINYSDTNSTQAEIGRDKLVFIDDWFYLSVYMEQNKIDAGFRVFVGNLDKSGDIKCWEMGYEYFFKKKLINKIPILRLYLGDSEKENSSDSTENLLTSMNDYYNSRDEKEFDSLLGSIREIALVKEIKSDILYFDVDDIPKRSYRKLLRQATIYPGSYAESFGQITAFPFYSYDVFDTDFFKKVAKNRKPDIVLKTDSSVQFRKKNNIEKRLEKRFEINQKREYLKLVLGE